MLIVLGTRWSERVDAIKPIAHHLPGIIKALEELHELPGLETKCKHTINGALKYVSTFTCLIMASMWYKILSAIQNVNLVIQGRDSTIDVEVDNLEDLTKHLVSLRDRWGEVYNEAVVVAQSLNIKDHHRIGGIRRSMGDITEDTYRINVYYKAIDSVLAGLSTRYQAVRDIATTFRFL